MNEDLEEYIKNAKSQGLSDEHIRKALLDAGWDLEVIEKHLPSSTLAEQTVAATMKPDNAHTEVQNTTTASPEQPTQVQDAVPPNPVKQSFFKTKLFIILLIALVGLGAGGYFAYAYVYKNPDNVWKKFTQTFLGKKSTEDSKIYQNTFKISYHDPLSISDKDAEFSSFLSKLKDFTVGFEGNFYLNYADAEKPQSTSDVKYIFSSGNTSFTTGLSYKLIDQTFYVNAGENPFLSEYVQMAVPKENTKKIDWIKINIPELEKKFSESDKKDFDSVKEFFNPSFRNDLSKLWEDSTLLKIDKTIGKETINGVSVIHYKNSLDKDALKKLIASYILKFSKSFSGDLSESDIHNAQTAINALVDRLEIKEFDTWIGEKDFHVYRVHILSNAPSIVSVFTDLFDANAKYEQGSAEDQQRMRDIYSLQYALQRYKTDHQGYPAAEKGEPMDIRGYLNRYDYSLSYDAANSKYANTVPPYPTAPAASGNCTDFYNNYWYTPTGTSTVVNGNTVYSDYEITFCLGGPIQTYEPGIAKAMSTSDTSYYMGYKIIDNIACPSTQEKCYKDPSKDTGEHDVIKRQEKKIRDTIAKINFSAEFRIDADYHDYGKILELTPPQDPYNILDAITAAEKKSNDAKRLADVRQLSSALELYYNDKSAYPDKLTDMTPTYIGIIPTAPTPPDGSCTEQNNFYSYTKKGSGSSYQLDFCLGSNTGGYSAGVHTLSPQGI